MMMPNEYEEAFSAFLEQKESNYAPHAILMMAVRQHPTDTVPPYILHCTRRDGRPCPPASSGFRRPYNSIVFFPNSIRRGFQGRSPEPNCDPATRSQFGEEEGASGYGAFGVSRKCSAARFF